MEVARIEHGPTSYYSVVSGIVAVLVVAAGVYFYSHAQAEKAKHKTYDPNKPLPTEAEIRRTLTE